VLVDDIQFIAGKERTQEDFFILSMALRAAKTDLISRTACRRTSTPSEERCAPFEWGLIAISSRRTRNQDRHLQKKAETNALACGRRSGIHRAAIKSTCGELEGGVDAVDGLRFADGATISLGRRSKCCATSSHRRKSASPVDLIQKRVSEHFNCGSRTSRSVATRARLLFTPGSMYIVKQLTTLRSPRSAANSVQDHTTVLHSINKIEELRRSDKDLNRTITRLMDACNSRRLSPHTYCRTPVVPAVSILRLISAHRRSLFTLGFRTRPPLTSVEKA